MRKMLAFLFISIGLALGFSNTAFGFVKGIYLTQTTLESTPYLEYLIRRAKAAGITTFIIDMEIPSKMAEKNAKLVKNAGLQYVARIIVFPNGGYPNQVENPAYWEKRYKLVQTALNYGADQIQLDYIRYSYKLPANPEHAKNVLKVVRYFKERLRTSSPGTPLQLDVFGIASFGESKHIGQNLKMLADNVEALCPMVYPSHYEPFREAAVTPYQTIARSLKALRTQFGGTMPIKLYPFIEISNYRYPLPGGKRREYVLAEIKAVRDEGADGFYVWSAHNKYDYLFDLLGDVAYDEKSTAKKLEKNLEGQNKNPNIKPISFEHQSHFGLPFSVAVTFNGLIPTSQEVSDSSYNSRFFVY